MLGSKNMLGKVDKAFYEQKEARKSKKENGVWIVAKKTKSTPLNLKSNVLNQGEED